MSHTIKIREKVIEYMLRFETIIFEKQFEFMPRRSTTGAIYLLREMIEKYRSRRRNLSMIFIDLVKTYDQVPIDTLKRALEKKRVNVAYIKTIQICMMEY